MNKALKNLLDHTEKCSRQSPNATNESFLTLIKGKIFMQTYIVDSSEPIRLDVWLSGKLDQSRSQVQKLIKSGGVLVNGKARSPHFEIKNGDEVEIKETKNQPRREAVGAPTKASEENKKTKRSLIKEIVLSSVPGRNAIVDPRGGYFKMDRNRVKENILELVVSSLSSENCKNIDHFFFHQASKRVLQEISERLKIPNKKIHSTLWNYSNTGAASIPITLDRAVRLGKIQRGDRVLLCGFGAGYEYVHVILDW